MVTVADHLWREEHLLHISAAKKAAPKDGFLGGCSFRFLYSVFERRLAIPGVTIGIMDLTGTGYSTELIR